MKPSLTVVTLLGLATLTLVNAQQQPPALQLNVPYLCPGNVIVVVKHCEKRNGTDTCSLVKGAPNGPLGNEISMAKAQAVSLGLICSLQGGGQPSQAPGTPALAAKGKLFTPPYLSEMPSPERVMEAMKANDPRETAVRQIWAFYELTEIIKTLSGNREFDRRNGFLPDEVKIIGDYQVAQYKVNQTADKAFPSNKPSEDLTYHFSRWDPKFGYKGINIWQFFSDGLQSQFAQVVSKDNARYASLRAEQKRIAAQGVSANPEAAAGASGQGQSPFVRNDPGTLAARRCVELGGSELECIGKGLFTGLTDLTGVNPAAMKGPGPSGVVMNGRYANGSGLDFSFGPESLSLTGCGKLVPNGHSYSITKKPNQLLILVKSEPSSFALSMGQDGKLSGPGPVDVKGQIITGYRNVWMQEYKNGAAVAGGGYWTQEPIYASKTERCAIGTLTQLPPPPPDKSQLINAVTSALDSITPTGPSGLRMTGHFVSQSGLALEFAADSVILDCGAAHVKQAYTVENAVNQLLINIKNGSSPFTLALQPNGALAGPGTADVAGRAVTGSSGDALTYAPKNARCAIGTLTPSAGN